MILYQPPGLPYQTDEKGQTLPAKSTAFDLVLRTSQQ